LRSWQSTHDRSAANVRILTRKLQMRWSDGSPYKDMLVEGYDNLKQKSYSEAVTTDKRNAQQTVVSLLFPEKAQSRNWS
jgi:hypothetical protein